MAKRRVVLTGAAGYVAQRMFKALDERWDVVPIDIRDKTRDGKPVPRLVVSDLTQPDRNAIVRIAEAFLYNDAAAGIRGDVDRLRDVQGALLGIDGGRPSRHATSARARG